MPAPSPGPDPARALCGSGIDTGAAELTELTAALDRELTSRGWSPAERPFRPHLTLARSDGVGTGTRTAARLVDAAADLDVRWTVDRMVLFESLTGGGPARYIRWPRPTWGASPTA